MTRSARGRVWVRLASRPVGSGQAWQPRAQLPVYVLATKLSEERYNVMVEQLRALAAGLVFDLYSKMFRSLQFAESAGAVSSRSSQVELRLLERLWASLAPGKGVGDVLRAVVQVRPDKVRASDNEVCGGAPGGAAPRVEGRTPP